MEEIQIITDDNGNKVVMIPDIIFANKQKIAWNKVESYLTKYVGQIIEIVDTKDIINIGNELPDEYSSSKKEFAENRKIKHSGNAGKGWYYYTTRFAIPIYNNERKIDRYSVYTARLVVNHATNGKMYLYDLVDIKKEASNPLKTE